MNKTLNIVSLLLILCSMAITAQSQEAGVQFMVKAEVTPDTILLGDRVEVTVWATAPKEYTLQFPAVADTIVGGVEVIQQPRIDTLRSKHRAMQELIYRIPATSFDSGTHVIPEMEILLVHDGQVDTICSLPTQLTVQTIPRDPNLEGVHDIKPPVDIPYTFAEVAPWVGLGLVIAALIALAVLYYIRRKRNQPLFFPAKPKDPPHIIAFRELEQIKEQRLWETENHKQFYSRLTDVLRIYIEDRFYVPAMEQTTPEIIQGLRDGEHVDRELVKETQEILTQADLVKFARFPATLMDKQSSFEATYKFVDTTKPLKEDEPEENISNPNGQGKDKDNTEE